MFKRTLGALLLAGATAGAHAAANRPAGFTALCKVDQTCSVSGNTLVAFGAAGQFVYKTLAGSFVCNAATFGSDPNPAKSVKECSIGSGANSGGDSGGGIPDQTAEVSLQSVAGDGRIDLNWSVAGTIASVQIMRDTDANPSGRQRIAILSGTVRSYTDTGLQNGTTYWYWIKYLDSTGSTANSLASSATPASAGNGGGNNGGGTPGGSAKCVAGATFENETVDCGGKTIGLSCSGSSETQPPVLTLKNASVRNVRLAANGGSDGIHCVSGNCTLENVVWEDICEDAATNKSEGGTLTIIGGSAYNDTTGPGGKPDKIFQHNSRNSTTVITGGFTVRGTHGKLWRSCGNCSNNGGPRYVSIDDVIVEGTITSGVVGVNRNYGDRATIRNLKIRGYQPGSPDVCDEYQGVQKGSSSSQYGEFWNTANCNVSPADVIPY